MSTSLSRPWFSHDSIWIFVTLLILGLVPALHADQSIILRSGNGVVGAQDAQVHFIGYGVGQDAPPTASTFSAAQTGRLAYVDAPLPPYITPAHFSDPLAQWIGTTPSLGAGSALYAIPFRVTDPIVAAASLSLGYSVDNAVHGVYINGTEISNFINDGDYHGEYYAMRSDIAFLLIPNATNWLYIRTYDSGVYAGLIFSATINTQGTSPGAPTITPNQGGNSGSVSFRIIGSGFEAGTSPGATPTEAGPTVTLTGTGSTVTATNVSVASPNVLTGTFDLTTASAGVATVTVNNRDRTSTVLSNAFTVISGGAANVQIQKVGSAAVAGYNETFFITAKNTGTLDSGVIPIDENPEPWFTGITTSATPTSSQTEANPIVDNASADYKWDLEWDLPNIAAGTSTTVTYSGLLNPYFPAGGAVHGTACLETKRVACRDQFISCINLVGYPTAGTAAKCATQNLTPSGIAACIAKSLPGVGACVTLRVFCSAIGHDECAVAAYNARASKDPNDINGPSGFGTPQWIQTPAQASYALSFNNLASATKAATNVAVNESFDAGTLDLATLAVNAVMIGNVSYVLPGLPIASQPFIRDIDLRPSQNLLVRVAGAFDQILSQVTVTLASLDPVTRLAPSDPTVGFLAPDTGGTILFNADVRPNLVTGTIIATKGNVVFDTNSAIDTNIWSNSIDISPPISLVTALPAVTTNPNLNVAWSGTDVGSGIQAYTIYASVDGGQFTPWLVGTTSTSAIYPSIVGHTYGFYSIATDNVGNVEAAKTAAEATTQTQAASPAQIVVTKTLSRDAQNNVVANVTLTNTGGSTALSTLLTLAKIGTVSLTPLSGTPVDIPAGSSSTVTLIFPPSVGRTGAASTLTAGGTYTGGSFNFSSRITLP